MMQFQREPGRIYFTSAEGTLLAEVTFSVACGRADIQHTFVDSSLRGQGVAAQLLQAVADEIRTLGLKAKPTCTYAVKWFSENPDYADLL